MAGDRLRKLGTVVNPILQGNIAGGVCTPFEIRTTKALKRLWLKVSGTLASATNAASASQLYQVARLFSSIQMRVNQAQGPFAVDGLTLLYKNFKDYGVIPIQTDAAVTQAAGKAFSGHLCLDFSIPHYAGGDLTLFVPKLGNLYTLELTLAAATALLTPANAGETTFDGPITIEVWSQEIENIPNRKNKYNASYLITDSGLVGANPAYSVKIPYGTLLNELHIHTMVGAAYDGGVVDNIIFRNGQSEIFRNVSTAFIQPFADFINPLVRPTATPAGIYFLDLAINNDLSSLLLTAGMKELELNFNGLKTGTIKVLVNELRDGLD
jgi:hypothetical protein